jgi:hypothetical protein
MAVEGSKLAFSKRRSIPFKLHVWLLGNVVSLCPQKSDFLFGDYVVVVVSFSF